MNTESVTLYYAREGREGQVIEGGTYDGWIILTDRNGLVEIVSPDVAKDAEGNVLTLTLGSGDTSVTVTKDLDGDETYENDPQDTAILSYNNAITTINNYCKEVMDMENVRSVGGTNNSATPYSSTNYDAWSPVTVDVASGDMQYELDFVKLSYFGKVATTNEYWLASRCLDEYSGGVSFYVRDVREGSQNNCFLWGMASDGHVVSNNPSRGVRPVVINPSGI